MGLGFLHRALSVELGDHGFRFRRVGVEDIRKDVLAGDDTRSSSGAPVLVGSNGYGNISSPGCPCSARSRRSAIGPQDRGFHNVRAVSYGINQFSSPVYRGFRYMEAFLNRGWGPVFSGCGGIREGVTSANQRLTGGIGVPTSCGAVWT